jgi:transposase
MGRKVKQLKNYTTQQLESLLESDEKHKFGVKLYAIIQMSRGYSSCKLEEFYHTSFKQINNWAARLDSEGIDGLRIKPGRGRHALLTTEQKQGLYDDLASSPEIFNYNTANWTGALLKNHIQKKYNVSLKLSTVYHLMHDLGFSLQRAAGKYPERNEVQRNEDRADIKKVRILCYTY